MPPQRRPHPPRLPLRPARRYRRLRDRAKANGTLVSFVIERRLLEKARRTAEHLNWPLSQLLRVAVRQFLAAAGPTQPRRANR
jgi:hypothetical protein